MENIKLQESFILESAAEFYSCVVAGSADRKVDLPAASGASKLKGILLPKLNATSYSANDGADVAREGVVRYNKASGYVVGDGDPLAVYDANGNLAPVSALSVASGSNIECMGFADDSSASDDLWGYIKLDRFIMQAE